MSKIYNLDYEKTILGYIISHPTFLGEIPKINEKDFSSINKVVFSGIKSCLQSDSSGFSKIVLIQKLVSLNIKFANDIEPAIYIDALELLSASISGKAALGIAKQLKGITIRRKLNEAAMKMMELTAKDDGKKIGDLISEATHEWNKEINILDSNDNEPQSLYGGMRKLLLGDVKSIFHDGIQSPFPIWNDMFGDFDPGSLWVIVSRMKIGKSSLLYSILEGISKSKGPDEFTSLYIDTELTLPEVSYRAAASMTGIKEFYIRKGTYKNNKEMMVKIENALDIFDTMAQNVDHLYVGDWDLEEQLSCIRRWHAKNIANTGKKCVIVLDYFKLGSARDFATDSMFLSIGEKVNAYKQLAVELKCCIIAAAQANKTAEDGGKYGKQEITGQVVAGSDLISALATNVFYLQKLSVEEKVLYNQITPGSATHALFPLYLRQEGPNELNQNRLVKYINEYKKERYKSNYPLYSFDNFRIKEVGTFADIVKFNPLAAIDVSVKNPDTVPSF